jgi:hypothetical protein
MTFKQTIETIWGAHGQTELARMMGVDDRTVRRWIASEAPERAWLALEVARKEKVKQLREMEIRA